MATAPAAPMRLARRLCARGGGRLLAPRARRLASAADQSLLALHARLCEQGALRHDARQHAALARMDGLRHQLQDHWAQMRRYSEELIVWHTEVRAIRARRLAEEEAKRRRLAAMPLWQRLWSKLTAMSARVVAPVQGVHESFPALEDQIRTQTPGACTATASGCGVGQTCHRSGGLGHNHSMQAEMQNHSAQTTASVVGTTVVGPLSDDEKRHPFWSSGLGSAAVRRVMDTRKATVSVEEGLPPPPIAPQPPKGLFVFGDVGVGKTMVLDLFVQAARNDANASYMGAPQGRSQLPPPMIRRVHFNAFITECHRRLHAHSLAQREARHATAAVITPRESDDGGGPRAWNIMVELVRQLVSEKSGAEEKANLSEALDAISRTIITESALNATAAQDVSVADKGEADGAPDSSEVAAQVIDNPLRGLEDPNGMPLGLGVLCFDEIQMMDIADATVVTGVLRRLFDAGWTVVVTCNRSPNDLNATLLHREHPQARFAELLLSKCDSVHVIDPLESPLDYRRLLAPAKQQVFFSKEDPGESAALETRFMELSLGRATNQRLRIAAGRQLDVLATPASVARLSFHDLCANPLGAADYIALAQEYHTLFLTDVPQLSLQERDQARRFITLIDQLYNHKTRLIASLAVPLEDLFSGSGTASDSAMTLEGVEFEGEAGKAAELNPIGNTANSLELQTDTGRVAADSRKLLVGDSLFTGEDEVFAFRRALSR